MCVIDPVLKPGITLGVGSGEVVEDDRAAAQHHEAGPDQQYALLPIGNMAVVFPLWSRALRDQQKTSAYRVVTSSVTCATT